MFIPRKFLLECPLKEMNYRSQCHPPAGHEVCSHDEVAPEGPVADRSAYIAVIDSLSIMYDV